MAEYIVEFDKTGYDEMVACGILIETENQTLYGMPVQGEIIRCRDCLHSEESEGMMFCRIASTGQWQHAPVKPDGFCAWGKRGER